MLIVALPSFSLPRASLRLHAVKASDSKSKTRFFPESVRFLLCTQVAQIFIITLAHFYISTGGSKIRHQLAQIFIDIHTVNELVRELNALGYEKVKLVMYRGFYSADNINGFYKEHYKFPVGASTSLSYVKEYIHETGNKKDNYIYYISRY